MAVDITEWVGREEERARAAKSEAIGVLAGGLAHDLNNLMTGVLGSASLAMDMLAENHPVRSLLDNGWLHRESGPRQSLPRCWLTPGRGGLVDARKWTSRGRRGQFVGRRCDLLRRATCGWRRGTCERVAGLSRRTLGRSGS